MLSISILGTKRDARVAGAMIAPDPEWTYRHRKAGAFQVRLPPFFRYWPVADIDADADHGRFEG
jgi:hypothetical protein